jgi:hypothetical protein
MTKIFCAPDGQYYWTESSATFNPDQDDIPPNAHGPFDSEAKAIADYFGPEVEVIDWDSAWDNKLQ